MVWPSSPAGKPESVVQVLNTQINQLLSGEVVRTRLATEGGEATPTTPRAFADLIASEKRRWEAVINAAKVAVD